MCWNTRRRFFVMAGLLVAGLLVVAASCAPPAAPVTATVPAAAVATNTPAPLPTLAGGNTPTPGAMVTVPPAASPTVGAGGTSVPTKPAGGTTPAAGTTVTPGSGGGGKTGMLTPVPLGPGDATRGQQLLTSRGCVACHTIGGGQLVGPDLKGVTVRRTPAWIAAFISNPQAAVASGDPTATQLVQQYGTVMPNLNLSQQDINDLVAYLDTQK